MGNSDSRSGSDKRLETLATQHAGMYLRSSATHLLNKTPYLDIGQPAAKPICCEITNSEGHALILVLLCYAGARSTEKIFFLVNSTDRSKVC